MTIRSHSTIFFFKGNGNPQNIPSSPPPRSSDPRQRRDAARRGHARPDGARHGDLRGDGGDMMARLRPVSMTDRKSTRLNSSHANISYAVFCLKKTKRSDNRGIIY